MSFTHTAPISYYAYTTITRPNDTTAYAAGDVVGGVLTFKAAGPANDRLSRVDGAVLTITSVRLEIDVSSVPVGMTSFDLKLYSATPPSALADNAAWDIPAGDRSAWRGEVNIGSPVDKGSTLWVQATVVNTEIKLATGSSTVYAYLTTNGGYTPTAQAVKRVEIYGLAA